MNCLLLAGLAAMWLSGFLAGRTFTRRVNRQALAEAWLRGFGSGYGECLDDAKVCRARAREMAERN